MFAENINLENHKLIKTLLLKTKKKKQKDSRSFLKFFIYLISLPNKYTSFNIFGKHPFKKTFQKPTFQLTSKWTNNCVTFKGNLAGPSLHAAQKRLLWLCLPFLFWSFVCIVELEIDLEVEMTQMSCACETSSFLCKDSSATTCHSITCLLLLFWIPINQYSNNGEVEVREHVFFPPQQAILYTIFSFFFFHVLWNNFCFNENFKRLSHRQKLSHNTLIKLKNILQIQH